MSRALVADDEALVDTNDPRDLAMRTVWLRWTPWGDIPSALGVCLLGLAELVLTDQKPVSVATVAVGTLPVAFRRRAPLAAAAVIATGPLVDRALGGAFSEPLTLLLGPMLVTYTLAAHASLRPAVAGIALLLASLELSVFLIGKPIYGSLALLLALPALSGVSSRRYRALSRQLTVVAARLERERGASERLAVAEERRRIAGELHDAIAHAVSRMVVLAGGAQEVLVMAPERARAALIAVQDTGRDAIAELRHTLRILRTDDQPAPSPPGGGTAVPAAAELAWWTISWPWWADILLAVGIVYAVDAPVLATGPRLLILAPVVAAVAIALRRRYPFPALALAVTELVALVAGGYGDRVESAFVAILVVPYTLAVHAPPRRAGVAAAVAVGAVGSTVVAIGRPTDLFAVVLQIAAVAAAGLPERAARQQAERLQKMAARLARERDACARLAVVNERARVARELHDSVAHTVSVMVLQAGAAEQVLTMAPDKARASARAVEAKGRDALGELQTLLGLLHDDADAGPRVPQPSLTRLDTLIADVVRTGLPVELHVHGEPVTLPVGVDVSAYRIIQEALTNALKHAGPVRTTVTLRYTPDAIAVEILDHGNSMLHHPPSDSTGHGLIGMRERVALYNGDLQIGPRADAGYTVHARLPLKQSTP